MGTCLLSSSVASILLAVAASPVIAQDSASSSRVRIGFEIAPVPLDLRGKNRALVGLGSYLVNATGGCNDCHTSPPYAPGGDPFAGEPEIVNCRSPGRTVSGASNMRIPGLSQGHIPSFPTAGRGSSFSISA
jgi:hypothetical protein